jgi:hypothetical protein
VSGAIRVLVVLPLAVGPGEGEALPVAVPVACCAVGCMRSAGPAVQPAMASPAAAARTAAVPRLDVVRPIGIDQFPLGPSAAST